MAQHRFIFEAVAAELPSDLGDRPLVKRFGAQNLHVHEDAPRVVWVPREDTYGSPIKPKEIAKGGARAIWGNAAGVEVHVWGRTYDEAEELRDLVLGAIHKLAAGSYVPRRGAWDDAGETAESGIAYVLLLEMQVPVTLAPEEARRVTEYPIASKVVIP